MTDLDFEVGAHDVEIKLGEISFDLSFVVTLGQFLETLEHTFSDFDVSARITKYITRQACNAYDDEKVFTDNADLDRFIEQLKKVME